MAYRGIDPKRLGQNLNIVDAAVGELIIMRRFVSASGVESAAAAGFAPSAAYIDTPMTAHLQRPTLRQQATPAGRLTDGAFGLVLPICPSPDDRLMWRGAEYRIDGDPTPARADNRWVVTIVRSE